MELLTAHREERHSFGRREVKRRKDERLMEHSFTTDIHQRQAVLLSVMSTVTLKHAPNLSVALSASAHAAA